MSSKDKKVRRDLKRKHQKHQRKRDDHRDELRIKRERSTILASRPPIRVHAAQRVATKVTIGATGTTGPNSGFSLARFARSDEAEANTPAPTSTTAPANPKSFREVWGINAS